MTYGGALLLYLRREKLEKNINSIIDINCMHHVLRM